MTCLGVGIAHLLEVALVRQSIQKDKPTLRQACTYFRIALLKLPVFPERKRVHATILMFAAASVVLFVKYHFAIGLSK